MIEFFKFLKLFLVFMLKMVCFFILSFYNSLIYKSRYILMGKEMLTLVFFIYYYYMG